MRCECLLLGAGLGLGAVLVASVPAAEARTSFASADANGHVDVGWTMELTAELPYQVTCFPAGQAFESEVGNDHPPLTYTSRYAMLTITVPDVAPGGDDAASSATSLCASPTPVSPPPPCRAPTLRSATLSEPSIIRPSP